MEIRRTAEADLVRVMDIYAHARAFMAQNGNPNQWGQTHPTEADIAAHIVARELYVLREEGEIHGVFAFILGEDPTYRVIEQGAWLSNAPYGTIHAVASDGQIHGLLSRIVAYCEQTTPHLRIDTHRDNRPMQRALEKSGFAPYENEWWHYSLAQEPYPETYFDFLPG